MVYHPQPTYAKGKEGWKKFILDRELNPDQKKKTISLIISGKRFMILIGYVAKYLRVF